MKTFTALTVALCVLLVQLPEFWGAPCPQRNSSADAAYQRGARLQKLYSANKQQQVTNGYTAQLQQQRPGKRVGGITNSEAIIIVDCGVAGDSVRAVLETALNWLGESAFDLYMECGNLFTIVTVQSPVDTVRVDFDALVDPSKFTLSCLT